METDEVTTVRRTRIGKDFVMSDSDTKPPANEPILSGGDVPPQPGASEEVSSAWIFWGFAGLGSTFGLLGGASSTEGIGQTLLTGLFAFVGGGALSFIGFVFKAEERPQLRARSTGQALAGLALGVWLGIATGIAARIQYERAEYERVHSLEVDEEARVFQLTLERQKEADNRGLLRTKTLNDERLRVSREWLDTQKKEQAAGSKETGPVPPPICPPCEAESQRSIARETTLSRPGSATSPLLHGDPQKCRDQRALIAGRLDNRFYDKLPDRDEAKARDERLEKELCGL